MRYVVQRLAAAAAVVAGLLVAAFFATHYIGDPIFLLVDREFTTEADRQVLIEAGGFNRPVWEQFTDFMGGAVQADFGRSIWQNRSATSVVVERLPATALLAVTSIAVTLAVAVPLAMVAARAGRSPLNTGITVVTTALGSLPAFWVALGLIAIFAVELPLLPTSGYGTWEQLVLPAVALSLAPIGRFTQVLEAGIAGELRKNYVTAARARGLSEHTLLRRHVLRNAAIIAITLLGGEVIQLFNAAVLVETIFAWPGVGQVALTAVLRRDLPVLMAAVLVIGVLVTTVNVLVDICYAAVDPRVAFR